MDHVGKLVKAAREAAGLESQALAEKIGLSRSAMSQLEAGNRSVKADEVVAIAQTLGISPLALLKPQSLTGQVSIAARTNQAIRATSNPLVEKLRSIATVATAISGTTNSEPASHWFGMPSVNMRDFVRSSSALADWARTLIATDGMGVSRFTALAEGISLNLGIDVLLERFEGPVLGGAITDTRLPLIAVNANQIRSRALFTLAHELGHVLIQGGESISSDTSFKATSTEERYVNAFAAAFLLPHDRIDAVIRARSGALADTVAQLMVECDVSRETATYRLHNLGRINAEGRDWVLSGSLGSLASKVEDVALRDQLKKRVDTLAERSVLPMGLLAILISSYESGRIGAGPLASVLGISEESVEERYGSATGVELSASPSIVPASEATDQHVSSYEEIPA
jgi:Zn-dependent peptidase ImmA (M78 family)/transcriptional regulator with XRE-family HTH domain